MKIPIKVLHCAETIKGGIATYLNLLIPLQSKEDGFEVVHVLIPHSQTSYIQESTNGNVSTFFDMESRLANSFRLSFKAIKIIKHEGINLVHLHSTFAGLFLRIIIFLIFHKKIKVVYCPHGWAWDRDKFFLLKKITIFLERALGFFTDKIVCISNHEIKSALSNSFSTNKLALIRNGIDTTVDTNSNLAIESLWPQRKCRLLFVGRLDYQKGFDLLIEAMNFLDEDIHLKIVGDSVIGRKFINSDTKTNVEFVGWLPTEKLSTLYLTADILVIPSRWEGFGLVALEGMKFSLPIVAARVGGLSEIVEHGISGVLFEPNSVDGLVLAISKIRHENFENMGKRGREILLQQFSITRVHFEIKNMYISLLESSMS